MKKSGLKPGMKVIALKDMDWVKKGMIGEYVSDYDGINEYVLIKWKNAKRQGHSIDMACWNVPYKNLKVILTLLKRVI